VIQDNPYQSPSQASGAPRGADRSRPHSTLCGQAKLALLCVLAQALLVVYVTFFLWLVPDWFRGVQNAVVISTTLCGLPCGVSAALHRGMANRAIGILGATWFAFLIVLAFATR
jgi:hypothetical protein